MFSLSVGFGRLYQQFHLAQPQDIARAVAKNMDREAAIDAMHQGKIVRGVNGLYLRRIEHGGRYLYRSNPVTSSIERLTNEGWRESKSFDLNSQFIIFLDKLPLTPD